MSELLSPERFEELEEAIKGMDGIEEPVEAVAEEESDAEEYEDYEEQYADDDEDDDLPPEIDDTDVEDGHSVPYSRFSKVIAARNQYAEEVADLRAQYESLQQQLEQQSYQQPQRQPEYEPNYDESFDGSDSVEDHRFIAIQEQMHEIAVQQEEVKLESELAAAAEQYPEVDTEFLLNAVIDDPNTDVMLLAEEYTARVAEIEEAAVARYLAENPGYVSEVDDSVPPEVDGRPSGSQRGVLNSNEKPKTLAEAHVALEQWLTNQ